MFHPDILILSKSIHSHANVRSVKFRGPQNISVAAVLQTTEEHRLKKKHNPPNNNKMASYSLIQYSRNPRRSHIVLEEMLFTPFLMQKTLQ